MTQPRTISQIVPDATALKALAHPVRMRMLGMLRMDGPATATKLAERLGLNTGATSYHLRQLAQHGFIEDAPSESRRDRWWRAKHESTSFIDKSAEGETLDAGVAFMQAALTWQVGAMQQALQEYAELPAPWREASSTSDFTLAMTPEAAERLTRDIKALLWQAMRDAPPLGDPLPAGTELFTVMLHAFPFPGRVPHQRETDA
jgi:DNA-binding transcriptional ArsR family regulator